MRRAALVLGLAALAATWPATAAAAPRVTVCGRDACERVFLDGPVDAFFEGAVRDALRSTKTVAAPPPQSYLEIRLGGAHEGPPRAWYAPAAQRLQTAAGWVEVNELAQAGLEEASRSVVSFPAPKPASARVNGRVSPAPGVYGGLLSHLPKASAPPPDAPLAVVELRYGPDNPWRTARLRYAPTENVVERSDGWFAVPGPLAEQVEQDLRREGVESRNGWASALVFGLVLTGALFVGWLTFVRRRWWKTGGRRRPPVSAPPEGEAPRSSPRR